MVNSLIGSPNFLAKLSGLCVNPLKIRLTPLPALSASTPNSCSAAEIPNICAELNPKLPAPPAIRCEISATTSAVAAPVAPKTFNALPIRKKSFEISLVWLSFNTLRNLPTLVATSSAFAPNSPPSATANLSIAPIVRVFTSTPN